MAVPLSPARPGSEERLARMVQVPTVAANGDEPFDRFFAVLAAEYPLVHQHLTLETVTDRGLLYHWEGASAERPIVLMAHYDVVPVEADGWEDDPFSGRIHDGIVWGRGTLDDKGPLLVVIEATEEQERESLSHGQRVRPAGRAILSRGRHRSMSRSGD